MAHGRVITLTGIYQRKGHVDMNDLEFARRPYHWLSANNQAQKARWLFVSELAHRAPTLTTAAVHPGAVLTGAQARLPRLVRALIYSLARPAFVRPEVGAIPVLRLAAHPNLDASRAGSSTVVTSRLTWLTRHSRRSSGRLVRR